jgi:hypothetical protein
MIYPFTTQLESNHVALEWLAGIAEQCLLIGMRWYQLRGVPPLLSTICSGQTKLLLRLKSRGFRPSSQIVGLGWMR